MEPVFLTFFDATTTDIHSLHTTIEFDGKKMNSFFQYKIVLPWVIHESSDDELILYGGCHFDIVCSIE